MKLPDFPVPTRFVAIALAIASVVLGVLSLGFHGLQFL